MLAATKMVADGQSEHIDAGVVMPESGIGGVLVSNHCTESLLSIHESTESKEAREEEFAAEWFAVEMRMADIGRMCADIKKQSTRIHSAQIKSIGRSHADECGRIGAALQPSTCDVQTVRNPEFAGFTL